MIEWTAAIALSSLLLLALVVPGTLLLRSLGASGSTALAGGPGLSMVVITAATILLPFLGLPWTLGTAVALLLGTCALGVAPAALRWWRRGAEREAGAPGIPEESEAGADATDPAPGPRRALAGLADPRPLVGLLIARVREYWPALIGVLAVAVPQTVVLVQAMGRPTAIFQNHDAMFHLNLIAEIEDSGNASLLTSAHAVNGGGYYPNLWHVVAAVLPGVPPTAAFNIVLLMVTTLLTPLGCIVLVRALGGGGTAMALAPFAATVTMWFPGLMLYFHGQTPTALSVALLPFALAAVLEWFGSKTRRGALCAAMAAVAGVGIGHAGAGQILLVVCAVLAVVWSAQLLAHWRSRGWWARLASPLPALAGLLLLAVMGASSTLRFMGTYYRTEVPAGRALLNALTLAPFAEVGTVWHHLVLMLASLVGLGLLIARRQWTFVLCWAVILILDLIAVLPAGWWSAYVGGWWRDEARYRAVLAVLAGILAAYALGRLATWCLEALRRGSRSMAVAGILVLALAVGAIGHGSLEDDSLWVRRAYDVDDMIHVPWVGPGEEQFMAYLERSLPDDAVVYGYPASGAGLLPVLTDVESFHRINSVGGDRPDKRYVGRAFDELRTDPKVCAIINEVGGTPLYYEDRTVDPREVRGEFPGYLDVDTSQGFTLLATNGQVAVWRVTACDPLAQASQAGLLDQQRDGS